MVNVNKNIVPGKQAESSAKPQAPERRRRNTALNSSKSAASSIKSVSLANIRNLNCSRESVLQDLRRWLSEGEAEDYIEAFEDETGAKVVRLASPEEAGLDGDFWAVKDGKEQLWYRTDGRWYTKDDLDGSCGDTDVDSSLNCEADSANVSGTVTIYNDFADLDNDTTERLLRSRIEKAVPGAKVDFEKVNDTDVKVKINCPDADAEKARLAVESSDVTKSVDWESATEELDSSKDSDKTAESTTLNSTAESEGEEVSNIKITTESGNEVSMQDIKIVQNPDTNELALFIPEDEEETIPEGFTVIGMVVPDAGNSVPAIEDGEEFEDGEELDSSKKKNDLNCSSSSGLLEVATEYYEDEHDALVNILQAVDDLGYGDSVYQQLIKNYGYEGTDAQQADEALIKMASDDADEHDFLVSLIQAIEDLGYGKQVYTEVLGIGGGSSVNSSLGGGDDRQDATSQVTVPKSFPDDKVHDLYKWVESELQNEGIDVDVFGVGRPSAGVVSFDFEVTGRDPADVDAIIEDRVQEFVQNGYEGFQYPEGDTRHGLNSEKHEKSLNCKVDNARVEKTEQGTWVVKADTDRFGKDAILYEHYSEEGANKYLDRLKAGGDAVANGYDGHIDPKKVDLDSGDGTAEAKLDKASISKAMSKVLNEDKDTPLVFIKLKDGVQAYIQPAGYEDNQLVADGNFDEAKVYVAMYDKDYKPIKVNGRSDNKMSGAEVVDYIKSNLGA